ncbi:MAG: hypothetical protein ACRDI2_15315 [Chloroflexota bacterium]
MTGTIARAVAPSSSSRPSRPLADDSTRLAVLRPIEDDILHQTGTRTEQAVFLAADGRVLFRKTGDPGRIDFTDAELAHLRHRVDLYTHNHPSGGSLGTTDVYLAMFLGVREANAFDPRVRYRVIRQGATWPHYRRAKRVVDRLLDEVRRDLQRQVNIFKITAAEASSRYWHEVWMRFASEVDGVT